MVRVSSSLSFAALGLVAAIAAGCGGPGLEVTTWHPATVDTGPADTVRVTDGLGRREAVAAAEDAALEALGGGGFYRAVDDTRVGLLVDGGRGRLDDGSAMRPDSLYLRLDVLEWYAEISTEERDAVDEDGNPAVALVDVTHAHAVVDATLVRGDGAVLLDQLEVEGIHDEDGDVEDSAKHDALEDAVDHIAADITPRSSRDFVPFDDRDEDERPILDQAERGDLAGAVAAEDVYIAAHDALAAPRYNRAVMLDARGDFDAALAGYDDAQSRCSDEKLASLIAEARARCLDRRDAARALGL